jgi:hypothetical protein
MINNNIVGEFTNFIHLGCQLGSNGNYNLQNKLQRFDYLCGKIKRMLLNKSQQVAILKFYNVLTVSALLYGSKY